MFYGVVSVCLLLPLSDDIAGIKGRQRDDGEDKRGIEKMNAGRLVVEHGIVFFFWRGYCIHNFVKDMPPTSFIDGGFAG